MLLLPPPRCERCGSTSGVQMEPGRTAYSRTMTPLERRIADAAYDAREEEILAADAVWRLSPEGAPKPSGEVVYRDYTTDDEVANRDVSLCRGCAADYHAAWDEQWADYYSGRL